MNITDSEDNYSIEYFVCLHLKLLSVFSMDTSMFVGVYVNMLVYFYNDYIAVGNYFMIFHIFSS